MKGLEVKKLKVSVDGKMILNGINLTVKQGEVIALMGRNGSGKSTLANTLMGHPKYKVEEGSVKLNGEDILSLPAYERSKKGLFLSFQYPAEIQGVTLSNFLRATMNARRKEKIPVLEFVKLLKKKMAELSIDPKFASRYLNHGFSGGEKKRSEILQLALLEPKIAVLDETDSGLDIDALKTVAQGVKKLVSPKMGVLIITHYQRILNYLKPDRVHVMMDGKIVKSGGKELVKLLEKKGYEGIEK
ncbi:MAG TPA: Fe-S cluster assembly ATPase SufC [Candidatus Nanoarchaeia archaeon]|nr:Fe-S cluster assembly ATPase SufC [Candidatus Nanoarchaeia archaeon]